MPNEDYSKGCSHPEPPKTTNFGTKLELEEATFSSLRVLSLFEVDSSIGSPPFFNPCSDRFSTFVSDPAAFLHSDNKQSVTNQP